MCFLSFIYVEMYSVEVVFSLKALCKTVVYWQYLVEYISLSLQYSVIKAFVDVSVNILNDGF